MEWKLARSRAKSSQWRMNDKFGRVQGKEKNQKSRCAGVHGLKGIYTDGRYLSARLPSLCSRLTKCLCTRTDPEWIELRSTRLRLWGGSPPPYLPQTNTVSALLNFKRNGGRPFQPRFPSRQPILYFHMYFSRKVYLSRGSVSMKSTSRSILLSLLEFFYLFRVNRSFLFHVANIWRMCFYYIFRFWIVVVENRFLNSKEISLVSLKSKRSDENEIFFTVEIVYFVQFNLSPLKIDVNCLYIYTGRGKILDSFFAGEFRCRNHMSRYVYTRKIATQWVWRIKTSLPIPEGWPLWKACHSPSAATFQSWNTLNIPSRNQVYRRIESQINGSGVKIVARMPSVSTLRFLFNHGYWKIISLN